MKEIWKDVIDVPGYQVSNLGRVKSTRRIIYIDNGRRSYSYEIPEKIMRTQVRSGYICVTLCNKGKHLNKIVHRMIAQAFIPNPNNYPEVNHKDENKMNNCVDNLEWCTREYNKNYGTANLRSADNRSCKVVQYDDDLQVIWNSINQAARALGVAAASIKSACDKKHKCKNFYWGYKK